MEFLLLKHFLEIRMIFRIDFHKDKVCAWPGLVLLVTDPPYDRGHTEDLSATNFLPEGIEFVDLRDIIVS